ncbi:hypothetical protein [Poseidonocella sp. HB161398]|uniref:hypothetical protein n=1 Tax=Poseidonocella sp. HB161398 TaxID=2320855 RepID=UPI0011096E43|nr:hypothetical protein [Poseidonocella sp. HB161398]
MRSPDLRPLWVAASIVAAFAALFLFVRIEARNAPGPFELDPARTIEDYSADYERARFAFSIWTLSETRRVYDWNSRASQYLFWVSMLVSVSGVAFAFWQFSQASRFLQRIGERDEVEFRNQMVSISVKTGSMATLVLVISIAYLLIYVQFVYEVKPGPQVLVEVPAPHLEATSRDAVESAASNPDLAVIGPPEEPGAPAADGGVTFRTVPGGEAP